MHYSLLFSALLLVVTAQITDPSNWPGFADLRACAQLGLTGARCGPTGCSTVEGAIDCEDWVCVCDHFSAAMVALSSIVASYCTSQQDVAAATSILNGFCAQLEVTPTAPLSPTVLYTTTDNLNPHPTISITDTLLTVTVVTPATVAPSCKEIFLRNGLTGI